MSLLSRLAGRQTPFLEMRFSVADDSRFSKLIRGWNNFRGRYDFTCRSKDSVNLLIVVAGYKQELWPSVFPRIEAAVADFEKSGHILDVCVVSAAITDSSLGELCEKNQWSYLSTRSNKLALAQNYAIRTHPAAMCIYKLDEDMVIAESYFADMSRTWQHVVAPGVWNPGILCPLINVNGFTSRTFLERSGRLAAFEAEFGVVKCQCMGQPVFDDAKAAIKLWEYSLPFDSVAEAIRNTEHDVAACPHRFSIGAFMMKREFWEEMGGFTVGSAGSLGMEEVDLSAYCMIRSRPILVANHIFCGHVGFGHQWRGVWKELSSQL